MSSSISLPVSVRTLRVAHARVSEGRALGGESAQTGRPYLINMVGRLCVCVGGRKGYGILARAEGGICEVGGWDEVREVDGLRRDCHRCEGGTWWGT